jgi:saxitoxin biosynthesis operon SxtJ-like protein
MILEDLKQLKTGPRDLRKFGLVVGGVFAALGLIMWARGKTHYPWFLAPGLVLMASGLLLPRALKPVYLAWMFLALVLGLIVSTVILTVFFFVVITGVGLAARLFGKDFLRLKLARESSSYWIPRERKAKTGSEYERQF